jgi:hypothetical protein
MRLRIFDSEVHAYLMISSCFKKWRLLDQEQAKKIVLVRFSLYQLWELAFRSFPENFILRLVTIPGNSHYSAPKNTGRA